MSLPSNTPPTTRQRWGDLLLLFGGIAVVIIILTRYGMPFRLDDVLYIQWARQHSFGDIFDLYKGELFLAFRPVMSFLAIALTRVAGTEHYTIWHSIVVVSYFIAIAFTGLTARYISKRSSALYIASLWYWLSFLPILNILFWFSDMTFGLEMMLCSAAWYFGLRGLWEKKLSYWIVSCTIGSIAAMTKEPSIVLIHGVLIGALVIHRKEFFAKETPPRYDIKWWAVYLAYAAISVRMYLTSNATSTRFFHIGQLPASELQRLINDRIYYYGDILSNPALIALLLCSVIGLIFKGTHSDSIKRSISIAIVLCIALLWVLFKPLIIPFLLLIVLLQSLIVRVTGDRLPILSIFSLLALLNCGVLLMTSVMVKTQLAELSFLLVLIGAVGASEVISAIGIWIKGLKNRTVRIILFAAIICIAAGALISMISKLKAKEQLLLQVKHTRTNANDAVKWMAAHLPQKSIVAVTSGDLYGIANANDLTPKEDEYKLYAQYTFIQGFIHAYFEDLNRPDLTLAYLGDTLMLPRVLDSCRSVGGHYLFLQTGQDIDRFHGTINGKNVLRQSDSLTGVFDKGGFRCEVWALKNSH